MKFGRILTAFTRFVPLSDCQILYSAKKFYYVIGRDKETETLVKDWIRKEDCYLFE